MKTTEYLNLKKPDQADFYNADDFNTNMDAVDKLAPKITHYAVCKTEAAAKTKTVACGDYHLVKGAEITVRFDIANTAADPLLDVNGTGAREIYYRGETIAPQHLSEGRTFQFVYNGEHYDLIGDIGSGTVAQYESIDNTFYKLLFSFYNGDITSSVSKNSGLAYNPSTGVLKVASDVTTGSTSLSSLASRFPVSVANGGTGATTAAAARSNLGVTPANIGALATTGGGLTGDLTIPYGKGLYWGGGPRITSSVNQQLYLGASNESDYQLFLGVRDNTWALAPGANSAVRLGSENYRWEQLYARVATISTSDRNEKNTIGALDAELWHDFILGLKPVSYKLNSGTSDRRHHGIIAQDVESLMESLGIASKDFAGFIRYEKTEQVETGVNENGEPTYKDNPLLDADGNPVFGYGLRYEEFIAPMISTIQSQQQEIYSLRSELTEIMARLVALEGK